MSSILGIKWQDYVSNEEVVIRASLPSIESILLQVQLPWAGHVSRMEDTHKPGAVFFSQLFSLSVVAEGKNTVSEVACTVH